jgi:hypothetical protein
MNWTIEKRSEKFLSAIRHLCQFRQKRLFQGSRCQVEYRKDPTTVDMSTSSLLFLIIILSGVRLSPLGTAATTVLWYQPQMIYDGDHGAIGGMKIGRGIRSTWRKPSPMPVCPPQIPHDLTRATAVGRQRLTAWAMARPRCSLVPFEIHIVGSEFVSSSGYRLRDLVVFPALRINAATVQPFPFQYRAVLNV